MTEAQNRDQLHDLPASGITRAELLMRAAGVGLVGGAAAVLSGCGSSGPSQSAAAATVHPKHGGVLRAGFSGGTSADTLNPYRALSQPDFARVSQLFDEVLSYDAAALPAPALATEVTPNADGTVWTIRLRSGVTFHNGKDLTADDLIYTLRLIVNPKTVASGSAQFAPVDVRNLKKLDKLTVQVPCHMPFSVLDQQFPTYYNQVVPVGYNPAKPIGTGPFMLKSFTPGAQSVFARNPNYWQTGLPYVDELIISDYTDEESQI